MILRISIWFNPWIPPIIEDEIIIIEVNSGVFKLKINMVIGAIFCHVAIIKILGQFRPLIISGNQ